MSALVSDLETPVADEMVDEMVHGDLTPYVPRLVLSWAVETPDATYRRIPGTMVFCDVSGFTALSERLASKGKVGAEELTEILDGVCSALLAEAARFGGSMLKYGGDAVLVFFWGEGHERRGAAAAIAMRAALRARAAHRSSVGAVRLRMSTGVHSGDFDFFLVGESHRELIVAGAAASLTCAMEAEAGAGEVLVSTATAAALPPSCVGSPKGEGRLLCRAPLVDAVDFAVASRPLGVDPAPFVPVALRHHLIAGDDEPGHRQVTLAFIAFGGVDAALAAGDGDEVAAKLQRLLATAQSHFDQHGIAMLTVDICSDGGKILAAAGAPVSWENNDERMLRAVRAIIDEHGDLELHAGINRGPVFTGDVGPVFRRTYTALGDGVNTTARVMASAAPGQIRVMPAVLARADTLFETVAQEPFAAKGKRDPLATFALGRAVGPRPDASERLPLVGRAPELARLATALAAAKAGTGSVVEVTGPAGIGKTRLVLEIADPDGQVPVLSARCAQYDESTPYFAVAQLIRAATGLENGSDPTELQHWVGAVAPDLLPWLPLIGNALDIAVSPTPEVEKLDAQFAPARMRQVVTELLVRAVPGPALWLVEDAHWIDNASREVLAQLARGVGGRRWLVVVTRRPGDDELLEGVAIRTIILRPLATDSAAELVRAACPVDLLPDQVSLLAEQAGGHPLFIRELAEVFTDGAEAELPDSVDALLVSRIDALEPASRATLRCASVLGTQFDLGLLRQLAPDADVRGLREFLTIDGVDAAFRQDLYRQAAYESLPYRQRRALHGAVARLLEEERSDADDAVLSLHYFHAQMYDRAWELSQRGAERARRRLAFGEAVTLYRRAVAAARQVRRVDPTELASAWKHLGDALTRVGRLSQAPDAFRAARRLVTDDPVESSRLMLLEGQIRAEQGQPVQAMNWYRRALAAVDCDERSEHAQQCAARLHVAMAKVRMSQGAAEHCTRLAAQAAREASAIGDDLTLAHACAVLGAMGISLGDPKAARHCERALGLYRSVGDRMGEGNVLNNLGMQAYYANDLAAAGRLYAESRDALTAAGALVFAAVTGNNLGEILSDQQRFDEATGAFEQALATFRAAGSWYEYYAVRNLGIVAQRQGDVASANRLFRDALEGFRSAGAADEVAETQARLDELTA